MERRQTARGKGVEGKGVVETLSNKTKEERELMVWALQGGRGEGTEGIKGDGNIK